MTFFSSLFKKNQSINKKNYSVLLANFFEGKYSISKKKTRKKIIFQQIIIYLFAIGVSILAILIKIHFTSSLGQNYPFLLLFSAILISGWVGGFGPALLATFFCAVASYYFFIFPHIPLSLQLRTLPLQTIVFMLEGFLSAILLEARRRSFASLRSRIEQQAIITQLSYYALTTPSVSSLFSKTAELVTQTLDVKFCKILELLPGKKSFLLIGGIGWSPGLVGQTLVTAGINSQGGYTLLADKPVIVKDLRKEKRFYSPELLTSHNIVSGMSVIIPGKKGPYGILGIHSEKKRNFTQDDIYFVQAAANILATAIEKKASENDLRESQARFKKLFDSSIIGTFVSDFNGTFLEANDALLHLIEYTREDLREGKIHRDMLTPPQYNYLSEKTVNDLQTKGISDIYEKIYISKTGKNIPVLIAVSRVDTKKDVCVGFVLDISRQKEFEKRKDEFISIASHELKTPITSLKVLTQFLKQKFSKEGQEESIKYLEKIDKQVNKLTDLIGDLLDITKIQSGKLDLHKELFNIDDLIREVAETIRLIDNKHIITIKANVKDSVYADRNRIEQVITNLLTNAIKYSPEGSQILIAVKSTPTEVITSVKDSGLGIEPQYQHSIFEQFFRIHKENTATYPGLGMGLFISNEILKRHKGKIWVESEKDKGATFFFSLPIPKELH